MLNYAFIIPVCAHPGATDEYGGHVDWENGEYHYHHGYPAHSHDGGVCPYDFVDDADHSYHGGNGYENNNSYNYGDRSEYLPEIQYPLKENTENQSLFSIEEDKVLNLLISISIITLMLLAFTKPDKINKPSGAVLPNTQTAAQPTKASDANKISSYGTAPSSASKSTSVPNISVPKKADTEYFFSENYNRTRSAAQKVNYTPPDISYNSRTLKLCGAPEHAYVDKDGLPHNLIGGEDEFLVYIPRDGTVFHRYNNCESNLRRINYIQIEFLKPKPCDRCFPYIPDTAWYYKYQKLKRNNPPQQSSHETERDLI